MNCMIYTIKAVTNLHVGDMGSSMSIVDNTVQRDALTNFPVIYATSLKGALRKAAQAANLESEKIQQIFGNEVGANTSSQGECIFHDAHLLFYPVRSNVEPYYLATCPAMIEHALQYMHLAGSKYGDEAKVLECLIAKLDEYNAVLLRKANSGEISDLRVEHLKINNTVADEELLAKANSILGRENSKKSIVLLSNKAMAEILSDLPIVARNQLENGISQNLWYEEFVPRMSYFITLLIMKGSSEELDEVLCNNEAGIQIGANATVGYGVCAFSHLRAVEGGTQNA